MRENRMLVTGDSKKGTCVVWTSHTNNISDSKGHTGYELTISF